MVNDLHTLELLILLLKQYGISEFSSETVSLKFANQVSTHYPERQDSSNPETPVPVDAKFNKLLESVPPHLRELFEKA